MALAPHPNAEKYAYITDGRRLLYVLSYDSGEVLLEDCASFDLVVMGLTEVAQLRLVKPAPVLQHRALIVAA